MKSVRLAGRIDWVRLKAALWLFGTALLVFGGALLWLHLDQQQLEERTLEAGRQLRQEREQYRRELESARLAEQYRDAWGALQRSGFLREPDRIAVVELLDRYRNRRAVPLLTYRFEPERFLGSYQGLAPAMYRLRASEQKLTFALHDETELQGMLQALARAGQGLYLVENCQLSRVDDRLHLEAPGNVRGECLLRWLGLADREEKENAG